MKFGNFNEYDFIGFHGQTIFHKPNIGKSLQIGNVKKLVTY